MMQALKAWAVDTKVLILCAEANEMVERSANNLTDVKLLRASYLNVRDLMTYDYLVIPRSVGGARRHSGLRKGDREMHVGRCHPVPDCHREDQCPSGGVKQFSFEVEACQINYR